MAKIGVLSDTHGNREIMDKVVPFLLEEEGVALILHLGDNYADARAIRNLGGEVVQVPGLYCPEYLERQAPICLTTEIGGRRLTLVHDLNDLGRAEEPPADIILFGHTHSYEVRREGERLFINPGHLKAPFHKGRAATFGVMELEGDSVRIRIVDLDLNVVLDERF